MNEIVINRYILIRGFSFSELICITRIAIILQCYYILKTIYSVEDSFTFLIIHLVRKNVSNTIAASIEYFKINCFEFLPTSCEMQQEIMHIIFDQLFYFEISLL